MNPFIGMSRWAIDCYIEQKKGLLHGSRTFDVSCKSLLYMLIKRMQLQDRRETLTEGAIVCGLHQYLEEQY